MIVAVAFGDYIGYIGRRRGSMQLSPAGFVDCIGYTGGGGYAMVAVAFVDCIGYSEWRGGDSCDCRCGVCRLHRLQKEEISSSATSPAIVICQSVMTMTTKDKRNFSHQHSTTLTENKTTRK